MASNATVPGFGSNAQIVAQFPNDCIQLDVYNSVDRYLESSFRIRNYTIEDDIVSINVEEELKALGYLSGKYKTEFRFLRNHLGSGDGHKLRIQEVSSNGLEVRVVPENTTALPAAEFFNSFARDFFVDPKPEVLPNLLLFKSGLISVQVFDYVQDRFTFPTFPYSIIFKLAVPAADTLRVGDLVWLSQEVSDKLTDVITLTPPKLGNEPIQIGAPNWEVFAKERSSTTTDYKDWDDLLTTNPTTTQAIVTRLFSGSAVEGVELNTDFRTFSNYIHFGSAEERLRNFFHKMELLEFYDQRISTLTPTSSVASSSYYVNNVIDANAKKQNILGSLDSYEKYLYYQSSSYENTGFQTFYPTTWPKSSSLKPYVNLSTTSSQVTQWYSGILTSASLFDAENPYSLVKTIPIHISQDDTNEQYVLFVNMIGHYFDLIFAYVKDITSIHNRDESLFEGFSKDLVYHVAQSLGVDFENGNSLEDLWTYVLGTDQSGSLSSTYEISSEQRTKEIWKRIINNLPYLLKTKGTERGIRALISCYGIPQTILRVREFGGPEPDFDTRTDFTYEKFSYSTEVGTATSCSITIPWRTLSESGGSFPNTVELRVKMHPSQSANQDILIAPNWSIQAVNGDALRLTTSAGSTTFSSSIYDGTFHHLAVVNGGSTVTLYARKTNYQKIVSTTSGSVGVSGWTTAGNISIPGTANPFSGSVQEFRYWSNALQSRILDNHALAPTSFQGNDDDIYTGSTSSFDTLAFRLPLGTDNNKVNYNLTSSVSSSHPNQLITTFSTGQQKLATFVNYTNTASIAHVEIHSLEWPDLGANRTISNKIRIDDLTVVGGNQLFKNNSVARSVMDNNPPDSSRLGIYLSPNDEVNQDIAEQFGGLSIDDFIGDPSNARGLSYPALEGLKREYTKKYSKRNNAQAFIRLLAHFDASLFQLIKKLVPYRANTQVGLVIESTVLDRSKVESAEASYEDLHWSSSLDLANFYRPGGFVQDGDGEPFRNMEGYVQEGLISINEQGYLIPRGSIQDGDGEPFRNMEGYVQEGVIDGVTPEFGVVDYDYVLISEAITTLPTFTGDTDQYKKVLSDFTGSDAGFQFGTADDTIILRDSAYGRDLAGFGSQYTFFTYATSGSGSTRSEPYLVSSSRYDYSDPIGAIVVDSRRSEVSNDGYYDGDIFGGKAFANFFTSSYSTFLTSSQSRLSDPWTSQYGLKILTTVPSNRLWKMSSTVGLHYVKDVVDYSNASINAFLYKDNEPWTHNLFYKITWREHITGFLTAGQDKGWQFFYGSLTSSLSSSNDYEIAGAGFNELRRTITKATGPDLVMKAAVEATTDTGYLALKDLSVACLNFRAQVQDYHLHDSAGMVNARYNGCKMTSQDWNIDSPDTIDGGPVVTITLGGGTDLLTRPTSRGTFEVRGTDTSGAPTTTATRVAPTTRRTSG